MSSNHPVLQKLRTMISVSPEEEAAVEALPVRLNDIEPRQNVVREGDRPTRSAVVIEGPVATSKLVAEGKRQIAAFHIPGDIPDLMTLHLNLMDSDVRTIVASKIGFIEHSALRDLCVGFPRIAAALWRVTLIDASIFREWVVNVGQRQAYTRLAHLFCEMMTRARATGLANGWECALPLSQTELAEASGMSAVHVNRTLQELRGSGHLSFDRGVLTVHNWDALAAAGDFDPAYLHLRRSE